MSHQGELENIAAPRVQSQPTDAPLDDFFDLSQLDIEEVIGILHADVQLSSRSYDSIPAKYIGQFSTETLEQLLLKKDFGQRLDPEIAFNWAPIVATGFPYRKVKGRQHYTRVNGDITVTFSAPDTIGLPYGLAGRHMWIHLVSHILKNEGVVEVSFGATPSAFLKSINVVPRSGRKGNLKLYRAAMVAIANLSLHVEDRREGKDNVLYSTAHPVTVGEMTAQIMNADGEFSWGAVKLSPQFIELVKQRAVPFSMEAYLELAKISKSALAIDIFQWLCYRNYAMNEPLRRIPWAMLQKQFDYPGSRATFRDQFQESIQAVLASTAQPRDYARRELGGELRFGQRGEQHFERFLLFQELATRAAPEQVLLPAQLRQPCGVGCGGQQRRQTIAEVTAVRIHAGSSSRNDAKRVRRVSRAR